MDIENIKNDQEENGWLGYVCQTGEVCPRAGYWEQIETGDIVWHEINDKFPPLESTPSSYKRANYKYIGKNNKS